MASKVDSGAVSDRPKLSKESTAKLLEYARQCRRSFYNQCMLRDSMLLVDKYYNRTYGVSEGDVRTKLANMLGKPVRVTDFIVPMVMPQVETATGKLAATFLEGTPIFMAGAGPEHQDAALQFNTVVKENSTHTAWDAEFISTFRDGFKYNICGISINWEVETTWGVKNDNSNNPTRVEVTWSGNKVSSLDMYNTFWDLRVDPSDVAKLGDFVGTTEVMAPAAMKKYTNRLFQLVAPTVIIDALNSKMAENTTNGEHSLYYVPDIVGASQAASKGPISNWASFFGTHTNHNGSVEYAHAYYKTTLFVRIIPSSFGITIAEANHPQIFKLVVINDTVLLEVERQTNAHDMFPMLLSQPYSDGLRLQTKSLAENLMDLQDLSSNMWNATLAAKRRAISDRGIYNPLYIDSKDINNPNPAAKIPLRSAAMYQPISNAYMSIPFRDEQTPAFMNIANGLERFSYVVAGTNPMQQGQLVKGNKTKSEVDDVMEGTDLRERLVTISVRSKLMIPARTIVLTNTLQYQTSTTYMNSEEQKAVEIDPVKLRNATLLFQIGDGASPLDREMSTEEFAVALQTLQAVPAIGAEYRVGELFAHLMSLRGADLRPFRKTQVERMYEQQMAVWQQQAQMAIEKGAAFDVPMPTPPDENAIKQEQANTARQQASTLADMVAAGNKQGQQQ
jgi:hypothetical protein